MTDKTPMEQLGYKWVERTKTDGSYASIFLTNPLKIVAAIVIPKQLTIGYTWAVVAAPRDKIFGFAPTIEAAKDEAEKAFARWQCSTGAKDLLPAQLDDIT